MIKLFNTKLPALLCFILAAGVLASCSKNDDQDSGKTELLSFGPTGASHGDTLRFIGHHLDRVNSIQFSGNNAVVNKADFKTQTADLIKILVPQAAERGFVTLKTSDGDIVTKTQLNLGVTSTVTSLTAQARPGENVTINGNYLNWVERVTFANNKVVTNFVSKTLNQLVVKIPDDAQTGPLRIFYGGTDSMEVETDDTLKVTLPMVTGFSPNPVKHAANLTINGTNLDLAKKIMFTGVTAPVTSFVSQSATQIVVKVPASTKKGKVTLEAASGVQTVSSTDLDLVMPAITTMAPNPIDPGADLTITGTNLDLVTSVSFENAAPVTTFVSQSATQIVVKVPMGVLQGVVRMGVLNSTLQAQSTDLLMINGSVPPPTMSLKIFDDAVTSSWTGGGGWLGDGWGGTRDVANSSPVRDGTKSVKINYVGGYGSPLQLGGANISLAPYTTFKISIYGAPGSGGKKINVGLNTADSYTITLVEGQWTDYSIPLSTMTSATSLTDIWIKEYNNTGGFSIYVDCIGLN